MFSFRKLIATGDFTLWPQMYTRTHSYRYTCSQKCHQFTHTHTLDVNIHTKYIWIQWINSTTKLTEFASPSPLFPSFFTNTLSSVGCLLVRLSVSVLLFLPLMLMQVDVVGRCCYQFLWYSFGIISSIMLSVNMELNV